MASGWITIKTKLDTKEFDAQIQTVERRINEIEKELSSNKKANFLSSREVDDLNIELEKTKNKLVQLKSAKDKAAQPSNIGAMSNAFKTVGNSIQSTIGKVAKLALGIFAIRSAYMAVRRASSELASYDSQYAANIEYIRYALTQMIAPVLMWIVQLAATVLKYINMILNALFGINLFSNASAENFNKMKAGAGGVSKAVKEIRKQLLGFDEINMLNDQSDTGTSPGAGGVGAAMPEFDLSKIDGEPPEWLKWMIDHKNEILALLAGIAAGLLAWKMGLGGIKSLGIGLAVAGIIYAIENLLDYLKDPTWKSFGGFIQGLGSAIAGLGIAFGSSAAAAVGAGAIFYGTIIKYWDKIHDKMQYAVDWLRDQSDFVEKHFGVVGKSIYKGILDTMQGVLNTVDIIVNAIKDTFDGLITFIQGVFTGDWDKAWKGIEKIFNSTWEAIKGVFMIFVDWIYAIVIQPIIDVFNWLWNSISSGAQWAFNSITGIFNSIGNFFSGIINWIVNMFRDLGNAAGNVVAGAFKSVVNAILRAVERILNTPIGAINGLIGAVRNLGINLPTLGTFSLPRLKSGGIVNMPNKGTLIGGSAIAGESGREGVIPLTDQQAMAELGREIGKNVLVNLTNITSMNGRIISRELKQVQSEQNFAYNS